MNSLRKNLAVFGGSEAADGSADYADAEAIGRAAAEAGWTIVNGGYGGCMEASARGAAAARGRAIGVTCTIFKSPANPFISEVVPTADLYTRLRTLIELGDAYVVLPGSTGTLAELALVWELVNKRMLPRRPILCWGEMWRPVVSIFSGDTTSDPRLDTSGLPDRRVDLITFVNSVDELMRVISTP